jgi:hypothetical protein
MYVDRSGEVPVKVMLWLRKNCDNFGLIKQHLGCNDSCGLMAVDINCRMLGTALCWNGRSDWLLHCFDVSLYDDWGLQDSGKKQTDIEHKAALLNTSQWQWLKCHSARNVISVFTDGQCTVSCWTLSECSVQCVCRTVVCCRFRLGVQNCVKWSSVEVLDTAMTLDHMWLLGRILQASPVSLERAETLYYVIKN